MIINLCAIYTSTQSQKGEKEEQLKKEKHKKINKSIYLSRQPDDNPIKMVYTQASIYNLYIAKIYNGTTSRMGTSNRYVGYEYFE
jgi:hypothetical protein